jgi:hypothetical protein
MKTRFSPCGKFLHIASLEGRVVAQGRYNDRNISPAGKRSTINPDEIVLSVFISTHRLSEHKTTRSPPKAIYTCKVGIGRFAGLSLAKLPVTFTWTPNYLYFSLSGSRLNVFRVTLFKPGPDVPLLVTPQLPVMLPLSATGRQVQYLPPQDGQGRGLVLMGSYGGQTMVQLRSDYVFAHVRGIGDLPGKDVIPYPCPPVGFYVDEERDLGGWGPPTKDTVVQSDERLHDARLLRRMEYFNFQDDIDLEAICDFCNNPVFFRA